MSKLQYIGKSFGVTTWHGPITRKSYKAGLSNPIIDVLDDDVDQALENWTEQHGLDKRRVFIRYIQANPKRKKIPTVDDNDVDEYVASINQGVVVEATAGAIERAKEKDIDLASLYDGETRITKRDVDRYIQDNISDSSDIQNF